MTNTLIQKKVCLLGDIGVGKTSLVQRFVYNRFEDKYMSTIGVKVSRKSIIFPYENRVIELAILLWDLAGSNEFEKLRASYLQGAAAAVMVCDQTRPETLSHLQAYLEDLRMVSPTAQIILAANKADLKDQQLVTPQQVAAYANTLNVPSYITSAKSGDQVETLFRQLGQLLLVPNELG